MILFCGMSSHLWMNKRKERMECHLDMNTSGCKEGRMLWIAISAILAPHAWTMIKTCIDSIFTAIYIRMHVCLTYCWCANWHFIMMWSSLIIIVHLICGFLFVRVESRKPGMCASFKRLNSQARVHYCFNQSLLLLVVHVLYDECVSLLEIKIKLKRFISSQVCQKHSWYIKPWPGSPRIRSIVTPALTRSSGWHNLKPQYL